MFVSLCTHIRKKIVLNCQGYVNTVKLVKSLVVKPKCLREQLFCCTCYQKVGKDQIIFSFDAVVVSE